MKKFIFLFVILLIAGCSLNTSSESLTDNLSSIDIPIVESSWGHIITHHPGDDWLRSKMMVLNENQIIGIALGIPNNITKRHRIKSMPFRIHIYYSSSNSFIRFSTVAYFSR